MLSLRHRLTAHAVLLGAGLLLAAAGAAPALADGAGDEPLPVVSSLTPEGGGCVQPSRRKVESTPWPQGYLGYPRAWAHTRGEGVLVAVVDTGVDATRSPALAGRVQAGPDLDGGTDRGGGEDCAGHGTFVAGLIAAAPRAGTGFVGVAPGARVLAIRVTGDDGVVPADRLAAGILAAVAGGARVVAVPLALPRGSGALTSAVAAARKAGSVVVAPAYAAPASPGTEEKAAPAAFPAALPGVLAVAAVVPGGSPDLTVLPRTAPGIAAPGGSVMSVGPGGGHVTGSGADLATGFVAGTAALVAAARPDAKAPEITARIVASAYRMPAVETGLVGAGTVDPVAAVTAPWSPAAPVAPVRPVVLPPTPASRAHDTAVAVAAGVVVALAALGYTLFTVTRARRRGWRSGTGQ
ncbi:S8 family serine peptidase [Streptomyces sp. NBC_00101]|uniref:S8 family serine peptidase n=1 Tax=Streptomyces sp. NBC_00101 TaxID=2975651 RepID=UPI00324E6C8B